MCDVLQLVGDAGAQPASNHVCEWVREGGETGFLLATALPRTGRSAEKLCATFDAMNERQCFASGTLCWPDTEANRILIDGVFVSRIPDLIRDRSVTDSIRFNFNSEFDSSLFCFRFDLNWNSIRVRFVFDSI